MKTGLVLEGGAMRGMFTAGVTDVMLENNITFDGLVGVSAGACFGCNYKSRQAGRSIRYNLRYCHDKRYCSIHSLLTTGDLFGAQFCYETIPQYLDPFDYEAFSANPMEFHVVCTDVESGQALYYPLSTARNEEMDLIRASASMPLVSRIVEVNGQKLLDGGIADSIPLRYFQQQGFTRNVVVLTQPDDYEKKPNRMLPLMRVALRPYPHLIDALAHRHEMYNATTAYVHMQETLGTCFVIRPRSKLAVSRIEHDPRKLQAVYEEGRNIALDQLDALKSFLDPA